MAVINVRKNEIQLKIVYYGPGRGGKTSSLEYIQNRFNGQGKGGMVKLKSVGDRTLFFDFYPMRIGRIRGYDVRVQLYSVPGQNRLQPLRKLVLKGVDSIVFVADAMTLRRKSNVESFQNLIENLLLYDKHLFHMPLTIQLNKVDLAEEQIPVISAKTLKSDLIKFLEDPSLIENVPVFETSAATGKNVLKALESAIKRTVRRLDFDALAKMG